MKTRAHAIAGIVAIVLIAMFIVTTVTTEIIGDRASILTAKTAILYALLALIPSVMIAGGSGRSLASGRQSPLIRRKRRRSATVAVIGLVVLVPCAFVLRALAAEGEFGITFVLVQTLELTAGTANLVLLALNARDGRMLTAARRYRVRVAPALAQRS